MDAPAIADAEAAHVNRLRQRRTLGGGLDRIVERQRCAQFSEPSAQRVDAFQLGDLRVFVGFGWHRSLWLVVKLFAMKLNTNRESRF
jgi:hypothetical protein